MITALESTIVGVGTFAWCATGALLARYVIEPSIIRRLVRARLRHLGTPTHVSIERVTRLRRRRHDDTKDQRHAPLSNFELDAAVLDSIGRELRLGSSLHASIAAAIARHEHRRWEWLALVARNGDCLLDAIHSHLRATPQQDSKRTRVDLALQSILAAADGADAVRAVEGAARSLRAMAAIAHESRSAVAHTRTSISVLTWIPPVLLAIVVLRDGGARSFLVSGGGLACLIGAALLHFLGRRWVRRLSQQATTITSALPDFIDLIVVHLRAGKPPALAFISASRAAHGDIATAACEVSERVHSGERFIDALEAHRHGFGLAAQPLIDALIDTERDGLSPRELFERVAGDAHAQRRRDAETRVRALPVRLTLPLVCCILPAYVLLTVVPLLASQLLSVTVDLP